MSPESLAKTITRLRSEGKRIVFTSGCFDLPHAGHLRFLEAARAMGDCLVLAIHSDADVRRLKGTGRPVLPLVQRTRVLAGMECVDYVTDFEGDTPGDLMRALKPDVIVPETNNPINATGDSNPAMEWGAEVRRPSSNTHHSTADILRKIRGSNPSK